MEPGLNLPSYTFKTRIYNEQHQIFDSIRRKFVALTPEEWVRQHFVNYLVFYKGFPAGLIAIEHAVNINNLTQRADIVSFSKTGKPILVVECKATSIKLTNETYTQAARYNMNLHANYLVVTNGVSHFCAKIDFDKNSFTALSEIPQFSEIS